MLRKKVQECLSSYSYPHASTSTLATLLGLMKAKFSPFKKGTSPYTSSEFSSVVVHYKNVVINSLSNIAEPGTEVKIAKYHVLAKFVAN